jgi:hypothetical protein
MSKAAAEGAFGQLHHQQVPASVDAQTVIRMNRDTLYSTGVFDLDAAPVAVTLPDAGQRYMSLQVLTEDVYTADVVYAPGAFTYTKDKARSALQALGALAGTGVMFGRRDEVDPVSFLIGRPPLLRGRRLGLSWQPVFRRAPQLPGR